MLLVQTCRVRAGDRYDMHIDSIFRPATFYSNRTYSGDGGLESILKES